MLVELRSFDPSLLHLASKCSYSISRMRMRICSVFDETSATFVRRMPIKNAELPYGDVIVAAAKNAIDSLDSTQQKDIANVAE